MKNPNPYFYIGHGRGVMKISSLLSLIVVAANTDDDRDPGQVLLGKFLT